MKFLRSTIGFMCVGLFVGGIWGTFAEKYGIVGGWFAAVAIIGPMWFMNHYLGLITNEDDGAFIDMGLGVGISCFMRDFFNQGASSAVKSLPTLALIAVGAVIGGIVAAAIERDMAKKSNAQVEISENQNVNN
ncbi:MAG: hypothetical protein GX889_10690 [Clostridiales bacterium]|nr:hypothetical protein [Clostridiales bacterium]